MCTIFNNEIDHGSFLEYTFTIPETGTLDPGSPVFLERHEVRPMPAYRPSLGFLFASTSVIEHNLFTDFNPFLNKYFYLYKDNATNIKIKRCVDGDIVEEAIGLGLEEKLKESLIADIARQYDKAIIEEVVKMPIDNFENLKRAVFACKGDIEFESTMDMRMRDIVTFRVPMHNLNSFYRILLSERTDPEPISMIVPKIKGVEVFNNQAIKVYFDDGSFTRCVCDKKQAFDFYTGIAFCIIKKMLGKDGHKVFNNIMRNAFKQLDAIEKEKKQKAVEAERLERKRMKAKARHERKMKKERDEKIDIIAEAIKKSGLTKAAVNM